MVYCILIYRFFQSLHHLGVWKQNRVSKSVIELTPFILTYYEGTIYGFSS